jgi:hypothetical protein
MQFHVLVSSTQVLGPPPTSGPVARVRRVRPWRDVRATLARHMSRSRPSIWLPRKERMSCAANTLCRQRFQGLVGLRDEARSFPKIGRPLVAQGYARQQLTKNAALSHVARCRAGGGRPPIPLSQTTQDRCNDPREDVTFRERPVAAAAGRPASAFDGAAQAMAAPRPPAHPLT